MFHFQLVMKSSVLIILAFLLATAILAPSVITLTNIDEKAISFDFNEEEKKEEKKEVNEKDFFLDFHLNSLAHLKADKTSTTSFYIESDYSASLAIFLLPPKHIL